MAQIDYYNGYDRCGQEDYEAERAELRRQWFEEATLLEWWDRVEAGLGMHDGYEISRRFYDFTDTPPMRGVRTDWYIDFWFDR